MKYFNQHSALRVLHFLCFFAETMDKSILIKDYTYELPENRIAQYPLAQRDQSKLLVYKDGEIKHDRFTSLPELLPSESTLFFNDTKVIPARLHFQKETGATIEIFLLNPVSPSTLVQVAMGATGQATWHCTIGNLKRWQSNSVLTKKAGDIILEARLIDHKQGLVEFSWQPKAKSFAEVISQTGFIPLPPYLNREAEKRDAETYQTVYSHHEGAVAAPTAGLHFTKAVLDNLQAKGHSTEFLTLHVSAGTFQPVKVEKAAEHTMHSEQVVVSKKNLHAILLAKSVGAVGTTSLRTLESLYWYGVKLIEEGDQPFLISQNEPFVLPGHYSRQKSIEGVLAKLEKDGCDTLIGETSIYAMPGYNYRVADFLLTNFHQPGSTLILLVAAFVGPDWKKIYHEALSTDYRFLSYGDSSLLFKAKK